MIDRAFFVLLLLAVPAYAQDSAPNTDVCFVPGQDCAALAVTEIAKAQHELLVQAYNFTEPHIAQAIIAAYKRGVAVTVIVDKTTPTERGSAVPDLLAAGVPVFVDRRPAIAHNKVMIVDDATVLTGSFNWSTSANTRNAENLLALHSPGLAARYTENFKNRLSVSEPLN